MYGTCCCNPTRYFASNHAVRHLPVGISRRSLHARHARQCRRGRRLANPSAMLGMFQKKERTSIVRCGAPVLRKVSSSVQLIAVCGNSDPVCTRQPALPYRLCSCHTRVLRRQQRRYQTTCLARKSCVSWLPKWSQQCERRLELALLRPRLGLACRSATVPAALSLQNRFVTLLRAMRHR